MEIISIIQRHKRYKSSPGPQYRDKSEQELIEVINDLISQGADIHFVLPPNNDNAGTNSLWWAVYANYPAFKRSNKPFDKIAIDTFGYVQGHIGSTCLLPYISAAQQSIIFLNTELQRLELTKISKIVFTNIIRNLKISNFGKAGLFKQSFLPAFTKAIESQGLESFDLIRRNEINQLAITIYSKERNKNNKLTHEFFTKALDKHRLMHKL